MADEDNEEWVQEGTTKQYTVEEPLTIGEIYFIGLGSKADARYCEYSFSVLEGNTDITQARPAVAENIRERYCPQMAYTWSVNNPIATVDYTITLDGAVIGTTSAEYSFDEPGLYTLCIEGEYPCNDTQQTCYAVNVADNPTTPLSVALCPGDCYTAGDGNDYCDPGQYEIAMIDQYGCDSLIQLSLYATVPDTTHLVANVCGGDTLYYREQAYFAAGAYESRYTNAAGCDSLVILTVQIVTCPLAGEATATDVRCHGEATGVLAFELRSGVPPYTYNFYRLGGGPLGSGTVSTQNTPTTLAGLPAGTYLVEITDAIGSEGYFNAVIREPDPLRVEITAADYNGWAVSCADAADGALLGAASGGVAPYTYRWASLGVDGAGLTDLAPGTYTLNVTDANGCRATGATTLAAPPPLSATFTAVAEACAGPGTGRLTDIAVTGGAPGYRTELHRAGSPAALPASSYGELSAGDYELRVTDANGCTYAAPLRIEAPRPAELAISASAHEISLGDPVTLQARLSPDTRVSWASSSPVDCENCPVTTVTPLETTVFVATAVSPDGCIARDTLTVAADKRRTVYVPTAFSPNQDGTNDRLRPFTGAAVAAVLRLRVYDRWGGQIVDLEGEAAAAGWDGSYGGRPAVSGPYLWVLEVRYIDGRVEVLRGAVSLLR
jgi:gliding motility-associated-like protein